MRSLRTIAFLGLVTVQAGKVSFWSRSWARQSSGALHKTFYCLWVLRGSSFCVQDDVTAINDQLVDPLTFNSIQLNRKSNFQLETGTSPFASRSALFLLPYHTRSCQTELASMLKPASRLSSNCPDPPCAHSRSTSQTVYGQQGFRQQP